jgi:hypothetical protein
MKKIIKHLLKFFMISKDINTALSKGTLGSSTRMIDYSKPLTWEFSAFSQNGEDGILDVLVNNLINVNKVFIEIGSANGLANNTAYLAIVKNYTGFLIEGGKWNSFISKLVYRYFNRGVKSIHSFVTLDNIEDILKGLPVKSPDLFCIDIDGNDYYIVEKALELGYLPSIFICEYNATYGPSRSITIPYSSNFNYEIAHETRLYYGVSIKAWTNLFKKYGYVFISVDSNGINSFFVKRDSFNKEFLDNIIPVFFIDNVMEKISFNKHWSERFNLINDMPFETK